MDDYFLKFDGIPGESADAKHKGEIDLASFSWGVEHPDVVGRLGKRRPGFRDFSFQMRANKASPGLFLASASGKHIKEANLSVRKAGGRALEYLKIKFTDVLVTSFEQASRDEMPTETVAFDAREITFVYTSQDATGAPGATTEASWDFSKNAQI